MQHLKLTIEGNYWDSYLYEGRLYLFTIDGTIVTVDWDSLIRSLRVPKQARLGFRWAFSESSAPYLPSVQEVIKNEDVRPVLLKQFQELSKMDHQLNARQLKKFYSGEQENPHSFPHNDIQIYRKELFVSSETGVYQSACSKKNKYAVGRKPKRQWEAPTYEISLSYGSLLMASGEEGLIEMPIWTSDEDDEPGPWETLVSETCTSCDWLYHSAYGSAHSNQGHFAIFSRETDSGKPPKRELDTVMAEQSIFGGPGFSWGSGDKIIQAKGNNVKIARYAPWSKLPTEVLTILREFTLYDWKGEVISGGCASFGVVIECENALVVLPSNDGPTITMPGEPVNWRTFNRSKHYENQLHVIYEDRLEVIAYFHDFFVDQSKKSLGSRVNSGRAAYRRVY